MPNSLRRLGAVAALLFLAAAGRADRVPLRGCFPPRAGGAAVPVCGGIPLPKGAIRSAQNVRLLAADGREVDAQVTAIAWWPDRSAKWVLVDAVLRPRDAGSLTLEYGPRVRRSPPAEAIRAEAFAPGVRIGGGGVRAAVRRDGAVLQACELGARTLVGEGAPARLVVRTLRTGAPSGAALPTHTFVCRDPNAVLDTGRAKIEELAIESPGPIRATVRLRGHVLLPHFGRTLPEEVRRREPAGRMPFTLRWSFYRNCPVIVGQHQVVFSGEPDRDFLARWAIELPGQAGPRGRAVLEPGVELDLAGGRTSIARRQTRLCWAPTKTGFALLRRGWENRPCAVTHGGGSAFLDFWPRAAGVWDLRRYAREWACGESGNTRDAAAMLRYAQWAARGLAKSHDFVLYAGGADGLDGPEPAIVRSLAAPALLVAPPAWYASTGALGPFAREQADGAFAALDALTRRRIDYGLYCQDLFRWHGKLAYGFWQTRFGQVHRTDRWERDYGRWGWSLNDGAGRIGHALMLQFLRTLDARYLEAGRAFCRANYDTAMVHTAQHLENARSWWTVRGCTHRHNVQPFGCPYIGMRGSNPQGQRILHLLTGDGVTADGLEVVADACYHYATDQRWRLGVSGGSDGQGSAACAMLWKYETTGEERYLTACQAILDRSGLVPPDDAARLGYGPDFGLFHAAAELAELTGDDALRRRVVQVARLGLKSKKPERFLHAIATAYRFTKDKAFGDALRAVLARLAKVERPSLAELPVRMWPGHAGYRTNELRANVIRDYPYAIGALEAPAPPGAWPAPVAPGAPTPAAAPADWYRPGGLPRPSDRAAPSGKLDVTKAPGGGWRLRAGEAAWTVRTAVCDAVDVGGARPLAGPIVPYVALATPKGAELRLASKFQIHPGRAEEVRLSERALTIDGKAGPANLAVSLRPAAVDGAPGMRVEMILRLPRGSPGIASFGLLVPLRLGTDPHAIQTTAPGAFRLERCRLDQNDERIPNWLTSEYHWGRGAALWPTWRVGGISVGPGAFYRIWRASRADCSPLFCDQGPGAAAWFDLTDRGARPRWGLTVRLLRNGQPATDVRRLAVRANLQTGLVEVQFHDAAAEPLVMKQGQALVIGAADLVFHDGWRPPLSKPELTPPQYERFLDDLDYGGNYGLLALRYRLSATHMVRGRAWAEKVRDLGIEPREILYGMMWRDGLAKHCRRIGVTFDANDLEGTVRRVIRHYRR